ncbi:MAG: hypothetical protein JEZ03_03295 [Bacteroidales bacterium]|nr:hypothetical protein [Bacteroidales bacterium]
MKTKLNLLMLVLTISTLPFLSIAQTKVIKPPVPRTITGSGTIGHIPVFYTVPNTTSQIYTIYDSPLTTDIDGNFALGVPSNSNYKFGLGGKMSLRDELFFDSQQPYNFLTFSSGAAETSKLTIRNLDMGRPLDIMTFTNRGYVGIGTTSPSTELDVKGKISANYLQLAYCNAAGKILVSKDNLGNMEWKDPNTVLSTSPWVKYGSKIYYNTGNVGIGTANPSADLEVAGSFKTTYFKLASTTQNDWILVSDAYGNGTWKALSDIGGGGSSVWTEDASGNIYRTSGSIGIGTSAFGGYKLAIDGNAGILGKLDAQEIEVKAVSWADYVFAKDYHLRSLSEVENFITENGHLPDVPSEEKVIEEGINVAEMDAILLQKIEELTLYMIEQQKMIDELKQENQLIKQSISK